LWIKPSDLEPFDLPLSQSEIDFEEKETFELSEQLTTEQIIQHNTIFIVTEKEKEGNHNYTDKVYIISKHKS
jgi:hypothetical protein